MNVGMIGLGEMGMPMLTRLLADGHDVTFVARRPEGHRAGKDARRPRRRRLPRLVKS